MDVGVLERGRLEQDLGHALVTSQLEVHYQAFVSVETRRKVGMEALARWRHPELGLISPDMFIPLAEETGLIDPLGELVLRQACTNAVRWPSHIRIAVNLSPLQFQNPDFADHVARILLASGLPPQRLELEITESVLLYSSDRNIATLQALRGLGIAIALDDFGTGYSSLSYLRMFPFDKIKIDKSFVGEMPRQDTCAAIVCAVANLGRSLGIATTAEGVETEQQFDLLRAAGCTQAQGYLFGRPRPLADGDFDIETARAPVAEREEGNLTARDVMLVRASFSLIVPMQDAAAALFYDRLFTIAPDLRRLFPDDLSAQKRKLMAALGACVGKLHDFSALVPTIKDLGARHARYGAKTEHYGIVAEALLWTLDKGLGASFTPETRLAWTKVYQLLALTMQEGAAEVAAIRAA